MPEINPIRRLIAAFVAERSWNKPDYVPPPRPQDQRAPRPNYLTREQLNRAYGRIQDDTRTV